MTFKSIFVQIIGFCLSPFPILDLILRAFKLGWSRLFYVKTRTEPPACLTDGRFGRSAWVQLPTGIRMHYVESGKGDGTKPLMVFLHGFPEFWFSWRYQLQHFSGDFWCIAPDLRGYNETSKPSGVENYSVDAIVDDVKCLIESVGRKKCILVGHDWGGAIGYNFCGKYPDMVSQYIVCNLPHPLSLEEQRKSSLEQVLKSWYIFFFQCPILPEMYFRSFDLAMFDGLFADLRDPVEPEIIEAYTYAFRDKATATATINYYRNVVQFGNKAKAGKRLNGLKVPVLSIFGTGDKYLSVASAKGSRKFVQDFEEHYIDDCSHWVQMERPDEVNAAIEKYLSTRSYS